MTYFLKTEPKRDPGYASVLTKNAAWIEKVFDNRNAFAHFFTPFFGLVNGTVIFEHRKPREADSDRLAQFESVSSYMNGSLANVNTFISEYIEVQRKRVPETERTKNLRKIIGEKSDEFLKSTFFQRTVG